jgi:hypothetical protein
VSGELVPREVRDLVRQLSDDRLDTGARAGLLRRLVGAVGQWLREAGSRAAASGAAAAELLADVAPQLPVRDLPALRAAYDGRTGDALAEALVTDAARTTAAIGAAGGALASAPTTVLAVPVQLAAETAAVVAVELKLVAELHVVYGRTPTGPPPQVAAGYLRAWADTRGLDVTAGPPTMAMVLGTAARQQLRGRLLRRMGRLSTRAPFLAGAAAGAELNRRETRRLGEELVRDLRR